MVTGNDENFPWGEYKKHYGWRKLQDEELHDLYSSSSIIRIIK
jgi:hypothetical protein